MKGFKTIFGSITRLEVSGHGDVGSIGAQGGRGGNTSPKTEGATSNASEESAALIEKFGIENIGGEIHRGQVQLVNLTPGRPAVSPQEKAARERRERIATAALQGILSCPDTDGGPRASAKYAVAYADALIAELDKPQEDKT